jgi:1,4-alpha-glucan branching enzyme
MISKSYAAEKRTCKVTFKLPADLQIKKVSLCGDFNQWDPSRNPMLRRKDGSFSISVSLKTGETHRFRYYVDNEYWYNDDQADGYQANVFGAEDFLIMT